MVDSPNQKPIKKTTKYDFNGCIIAIIVAVIMIVVCEIVATF